MPVNDDITAGMMTPAADSGYDQFMPAGYNMDDGYADDFRFVEGKKIYFFSFYQCRQKLK